MKYAAGTIFPEMVKECFGEPCFLISFYKFRKKQLKRAGF